MVRRRSTISRRRRGSYRIAANEEPEDTIPSIKISRPEVAHEEAETVAPETEINGTEPEVDEFKLEVDETEPELPQFKPEMHKSEPEAFNSNRYTDRPRSPNSLTVPPTDVSMGMFHEKPDPIDAARNILLQPEMLLLRQDLERKRDEVKPVCIFFCIIALNKLGKQNLSEKKLSKVNSDEVILISISFGRIK